MNSHGVSARRAPRTTDVAVVGSGLIGLACAWRLAQRGASVTLVDPRPGRGASWTAAGMLAPVTEVHYGEEALLRLNLASAELYPDFVEDLVEETGRAIDYRRAGTLMVARDSDDNAQLDEVYRYQRELGLEVERLSARDCRKHEPALSPRIRGGIFVPGDHQVDNRALVEALIAACEAREVSLVRERADAVERDGERANGVRLPDGEVIAAEEVLLAMGASTNEIGGVKDAKLPDVRPVKGQLVHLRGPTQLVRGNVRGLEAYLVGRSDGRVVVGATVEEQGFDVRITAGAVLDLLRAAYELFPGIAELEMVETTAGSRPTTPDNAPAIGPTAVEHLTLATGHYRNGVLLTPVTAAAITEIVLEGRVPDSVAAFSPLRFSKQWSSR